jgi:hypothetical protein
MPALKDFAFTIDPSQAAGRWSDRLSRLTDRPAWREMWESALAEAQNLVRPGIAYAVHPVTGSDGDRLLIADGRALESAVVARLFGGAPEVVLAIFTIGPHLERRVAEHEAAGDYPTAFVLDIVGSLAVNQVGQVAEGVIRELAASKGVKASVPLNPGTTHWPLSGNHVLVELTPAVDIGVEALESGLLRPFKSISYAVALGTDVRTPEQGSSCDYCDTRDLCRL